MSLKYKYLEFDGEEFLTVWVPGEAPLLASRESHTNFDRLLDLAKNKDESIVDEFDTGRAVEKAFADVVEGRVAVRGGTVYYDDDPQDGAITKAILRFLAEGKSVKPLVAFMDNVMANPQEESREQFFRWIETHDFPIDDDGYIVAYKGVRGNEKNGYTSISSGQAFVNGVEHNGQIPNAVGDVVTMPRSEVQHDPRVACHKGLHAGTWKYASNFAQGAVMHVRINPRDVVSVPHDCTSQKVRVCRYEVIGFAEAEHESAYFKTESNVVEEIDTEVPEVEEAPEVDANDKDFHVGDNVVIKKGRWGNRATWTIGGNLADYVGKTAVVVELGYDGWDANRTLHHVVVRLHGFSKTLGLWLDEVEKVKVVNAGKRDTRENHKHQKRDAKGHFIKN